ncbi:MAG: 3-dehydroquinate synthase [Phycisphaerales bacterium]|nr:3-dehydroquinate synthase [Phycisphaerales bacterium]
MNKIRSVSVNLVSQAHRYDVLIEPGLRDRAAELLAAITPQRRLALVCDDAIADGPGGDLEIALNKAGWTVSCVATIRADEAHKTLDAADRLLQMLADAKHERNEPILSLGGGITGDITGFAAAVYHRGTPFVNMPTTLLAMVDASVGGKTGVNLQLTPGQAGASLIKNVIGAFHQPTAVLIDPTFVTTLPVRHIRAGLGECVKHAVLGDSDLFTWIEQRTHKLLGLDEEALTELIHRNVAIKAKVVMSDERESAASGGRVLLNLGHTFAHGLEPIPSLDLVHGEAVGLGLIAAAHCGQSLGRCDRSVRLRIISLLEALGLPTSIESLPPIGDVIGTMKRDKKVRGGQLRIVLPTHIGEAITVDEVSDVVVEAALRSLVRA